MNRQVVHRRIELVLIAIVLFTSGLFIEILQVYFRARCETSDEAVYSLRRSTKDFGVSPNGSDEQCLPRCLMESNPINWFPESYFVDC